MSSLVDLDDGGFEELQTLASTYKVCRIGCGV